MCPTHVGAPQARNTTREGCADGGSSGYSVDLGTGQEASGRWSGVFCGLREWAGVSEGEVSRSPQGTAKQVGSGIVVSSEEEQASWAEAGWAVKNVYRIPL